MPSHILACRSTVRTVMCLLMATAGLAVLSLHRKRWHRRATAAIHAVVVHGGSEQSRCQQVLDKTVGGMVALQLQQVQWPKRESRTHTMAANAVAGHQ